MRMRHRVCDRDELNGERADLHSVAIGDSAKLDAITQTCLVDAIRSDTKGEPRPQYGKGPGSAIADAVLIAQEVRDGTDVVLVTVGGDQGLDTFGVVAQ